MASIVSPDTLIAIKINYEGTNRRFKLPLKDLGAYTFPQKIHQVLSLPNDTNLILERYSDSAAKWVMLDSQNPAIYKQLYRAAKAKLKLRIKVTELKLPGQTPLRAPHLVPIQVNESMISSSTGHRSRGSYLNTVLNDPLPTVVEHNSTLFRKLDPTPAAEEKQMAKSHMREPASTCNISQKPQREFADNTDVPPAFYIDCNHCGNSIPNAHWHCSICEDGDYDLCQECVDAGVLCPGEDHWLIKRSVVDGVVLNSTTETIAPNPREQPKQAELEESTEPPLETVVEEPDAAPEVEPDETKSEPEVEPEAEPVPEPDVEDEMRTCNACFQDGTHGHHPGHTFFFTHDVGISSLKDAAARFCKPGRGRVRGVRNKCLDCPDFDYCSDCIHNAQFTHPGHRFVPIYTPIAAAADCNETHYGIYCDGPLCKDNAAGSYITGIRYKCAICHDTDFCANCEALPSNTHNRTHPLLKFKTGIRHVSISTIGENEDGQPLQRMGDRPRTTTSFTEPMPVGVSHAATQVQKASELPTSLSPPASSCTMKEDPQLSAGDLAASGQLQAHFVEDSLVDGTELPPNTVFTQTWTLHNPGPAPWPKGCSIRFAGGDTMFNIDTDHPSSTSELISAMESLEITEPVSPLDSTTFTLTLKTPQRLGRAISYWRLKTPDGAPFGDRLWCDVIVRPESEMKSVAVVSDDESKQAPVDCGDASSETKHDQSLTESVMVFPKLDKESPETSIIDSGVPTSTVDTEVQHEEHDLADDVESLTMDDADSEGFLTDEEYDILDASDQEFLAGTPKQEQK
ncbi:hypothetical protein PRK78_005902 [Emydomyces testavorans]|uniref:ZZ-type domain-containing protein n=1 Tax=Emydomyces testavorans TaxID=2070801 RepID=A0AAF0IL62_9EURO|nr:hypothetical protein PRK78_005902 [Emydomyces testavorans]